METPREQSTAPGWARWALVAIMATAAWLRLPALTAEEPWFDEVFSIVLASQDLPELWRRAIADQTNPPGFYLVLMGWTRLGGFELGWMRLLPFLAAVLTVPATALAARACGIGWRGQLVAAVLAAASPMMFAMSSELRAYAPLALASALTLAAAAQRRPIVTALGGIALVMLHYFGAFVVAAIFAGTLVRAFAHERPRWRSAMTHAMVGAVPAAVALGAWSIVVVRSASNGFGGNASWIAPPGPRGLLSFGSQVIGTFGTSAGAIFVALALVVALALAARAGLRRGTFGTAGAPDPAIHAGLTLAIAVAVVPLLLVALVSALSGRELWVARYLIITLPGWWLLVAFAAEQARGAWREVAFAGLLTWASLAGIRAEYERPRRTAWSLVARALTASGPRTVCTAESFVALPLRYPSLGERIPLTVLDLADCTVARAPDAIILRVGTEAALDRVIGNGAIVGVPRNLGTMLPPTRLVPLRWTAP